MLECRLARQADAKYPFAGLISIVNHSDVPYRIEYDLHPLQYLDLRVERDGLLLPTSFYGNRFSAFGGVETLVLEPGETYTTSVNLLGNLPAEQRLSGTYRITAEYNYAGVILSKIIELCVG